LLRVSFVLTQPLPFIVLLLEIGSVGIAYPKKS